MNKRVIQINLLNGIQNNIINDKEEGANITYSSEKINLLLAGTRRLIRYTEEDIQKLHQMIKGTSRKLESLIEDMTLIGDSESLKEVLEKMEDLENKIEVLKLLIIDTIENPEVLLESLRLEIEDLKNKINEGPSPDQIIDKWSVGDIRTTSTKLLEYPEGDWMLCDGREIDLDTFPKLKEVWNYV